MGTKFLNTFFILLSVFFLVTFLNFSSNPPTGRTGAPLEGGGNEPTCMICHNPANPAFAGNIVITGLPASIDANTTYSITATLTATAGNPVRGGFQMVALNSSFQNTGTLTESSPNLGIESSGGRTYMEHRNAVNFTGNTVSYTFNWQAPSNPSGEVITLYAIGNIANGSGTANDLIVQTTQSGTLVAAGDPIAVSITASANVSCFGGNDGTATATATGGSGTYSFIWSDGQTGAIATDLSTGLATVTATDVASGGTVTANILITQPSDINLNITNQSDVTCFSPSGSATVSASGGTPGYSFLWDNGETDATAVNLSVGQHFVTVTDANNCPKTTSVTIGQDVSPPDADAGNNMTINCNNPTTVLDGTNSSSGTNFAYLWTTVDGNILSGAATNAPTVNAGGTYQLLVTNTTNGCTTTDQVNVTANIDPPNANAGSNVAICQNDNTTLMATATGGSGGYTFNWNNGLGAGASHIVSPNTTTTYTVTVTDSNGCFNTNQVTVTVNALPNVTITGDTDFCEGTSNLLDAGAGFSSYLWDTGATTQTITVDIAGTYCVTVIDDNGCTENDCIDITVNPLPTISNISTDCAIDLLTYMVNLTTNANQITPTAGTVTDNGGESFTISNIPSGSNITITATNTTTNCFSEMGVNAPDCSCPDIDAPTASSDTDVMICEGDDIPAFIATAPNGTVADWYDAGMGGNLLQSTSSSFTPSTAGTYFAASRDPATACTSATRTTFILTVNPLPNLVISGNLSFCEGTSTTLDAGPGFISYNWNNGQSTQTITVSTPGTYCVTAFDENSCRVETCVEVIENSNPVITIIGDLFFCEGECTIVSWGTGVDEMQEICAPGTYTISITDENGCVATSSFDVIQNPNPIADAGADMILTCETTSTTIGGNSSVGANITYEWSNGVNTATQEIMMPGSYSLTVTNTETSCSSTDEIIITANTTPPTVDAGADFVMPCVGPAPILNGMVSPNNNIVIEWMTADGNITSGSETLTPEIDSPGTYILTATNTENGCSTSDMVVVSAAQLPVISVNEIIHVLCNGETTGSISVSASGGTAPYTYLWDDMEATTSSTLSNIPAGEHTCTVTDANGCTSMVSITITEPTAIIIILTATTESANDADDGSITSMVSGGTAPYAYLWSTGSMEEMISGLTPETYSLVITDANGCTQSASAQVNAFGCENLMATTSGNFLICPGNSDGSISIDVISGGEAPYLIIWSTGSNDDAISDLPAGHYSNTITDVNNCALISEFDIIEGDTIPPNLVTQNISIYLDENGEVSFEPSAIDGGSTDNCGIGEFYVDNTSFDCSHIGENTVQVAVFDTGILCDADSAIVTVLDTFPPVFTLCPEDIFTLNCLELVYEMPVAMDNCGEITIELIEGFASGTSFPVGTTLVTYEATDASGNSATCSFEVVITSEISIILTPTTENEMDSDGTISSLVTGVALPIAYEWANVAGEIISTEENLTNVPAGDYCLIITDASGCSETVCATVDRIVAVNDPALTANIHIAPNPVSNQLYVNFDLENNEAATIILYDMNGRAIFQTQKEKGNDKLQIDVSAFANGIYLLKIIVEEQVAVKKILVSK